MTEKKSVYETELTFLISNHSGNVLKVSKYSEADRVTFEILSNGEYVQLALDFEQLTGLEMLLRDSEDLPINHFTGIIQNYTRLAIRKKRIAIDSQQEEDFYFLELGGVDIRLSEQEYQKLIDVITGLQFIMRKTVA